MPEPSARTALTLCLLLAVSAGCLGVVPGDQTTATPAETASTTASDTTTRTTGATSQSERAGHVRAAPVEQVPENATVVNASDERIAGVAPLQTAITDAVRNDSTVFERVTGERFEAVADALDRLDPYADSDPAVEDGYYMWQNETAVVVTLRVEM